jgi:uncharacterized protein
MNEHRLQETIVASAILAVGLAAAGFLAGRGLVQSRVTDRFVTVKGVSEREVTADLALWPFQLVATSNDLGAAQAEVDRYVTEIGRFLVRHGVDTSGVSIQGLEVTDRRANRYGGDQGPIETRFIVQQTIMVRSQDPAAVLAASQQMGELVGSGVVITSGSGYGPAQPTFVFTGLNDIKPAMIAEATAAAREAAQQFAADSRSEVAGIRRANQGVFVILPRDQAPGVQESTQLYKTVRVVSTIDYYLR